MVTLRLQYDSRERLRVPDVGDDRMDLTRPPGRDGVQVGGTRHRVVHALDIGTQVHGDNRPARPGQSVDDRCTDAASSPGHDRHTGVVGAPLPHATTLRRTSQSRP